MNSRTLKNELVMVTATLDRLMSGTHHEYVLELELRRETEMRVHDFESDWGVFDVVLERCLDFITDNRARVRAVVLSTLDEAVLKPTEHECRLLANYIIALDWAVGWEMGC